MKFNAKPLKEPSPSVEKLAVGAKEASAMLGISPRKLHQLTKSGEIPSKHIGRRVLYSLDALRQYVNGE